MEPMLDVQGIHKTYRGEDESVRALKGVSFSLQPGEFFTLLGPSGCGKTTMLRSVAGLEEPDAGSIRIGSQEVYHGPPAPRSVPTHRRDISMVFQSYAIWPHMTVAENVRFPLDATNRAGKQANLKVDEALEMVGLGGYGQRPATDLSGGQQQRVALARAIIKGASVLLLDEPLSNLDAMLRIQMRAELRRIKDVVGATALYVTHDQEEAMSLSNRVALMHDGLVVEVGKPIDLYLRPAHLFTAEFIGQSNVMRCTLRSRGAGKAEVEVPFGVLEAGSGADATASDPYLMIRPEHVSLSRADERAQPGPNTFTGRVKTVAFEGKLVDYRCDVAGHELLVQTMASDLLAPGDSVSVFLPPERCVVVRSEVRS